MRERHRFGRMVFNRGFDFEAAITRTGRRNRLPHQALPNLTGERTRLLHNSMSDLDGMGEWELRHPLGMSPEFQAAGDGGRVLLDYAASLRRTESRPWIGRPFASRRNCACIADSADSVLPLAKYASPSRRLAQGASSGIPPSLFGSLGIHRISWPFIVTDWTWLPVPVATEAVSGPFEMIICYEEGVDMSVDTARTSAGATSHRSHDFFGPVLQDILHLRGELIGQRAVDQAMIEG